MVSRRAFDYEGEFYRVTGARSGPPAPATCRSTSAGPPADAVRVGGGTPTSTRSGASRWRASGSASPRSRPRPRRPAAAIGRFWVSLRPIAAATEEAAWERANEILELTRSGRPSTSGHGTPQAEGSQRLLRYAAAEDVHDKRLWTPLSEATGAAGNSTALVGSYEQVAESLLDYVAVGATTLLIRGYDPLGRRRRLRQPDPAGAREGRRRHRRLPRRRRFSSIAIQISRDYRRDRC